MGSNRNSGYRYQVVRRHSGEEFRTSLRTDDVEAAIRAMKADADLPRLLGIWVYDWAARENVAAIKVGVS